MVTMYSGRAELLRNSDVTVLHCFREWLYWFRDQKILLYNQIESDAAQFIVINSNGQLFCSDLLANNVQFVYNEYDLLEIFQQIFVARSSILCFGRNSHFPNGIVKSNRTWVSL